MVNLTLLLNLPWLRVLSITAGLALAIISTGAITITLTGLATDTVILWFLVAAGIAFQGALYLLALGNNVNRVLSSVFLLVSVAATTACFEYGWQTLTANKASVHLSETQMKQNETGETFLLQQVKQQLQSVSDQINTHQQTANNDSLNWRRLETLKQVETLELRRETLLKRYETETAKQLQRAETAAPASSIEAGLMAVPSWTRWLVFTLLAFLLDLGAVRLFRNGETPETVFETTPETVKQPETKHETPGETVLKQNTKTEVSPNETPVKRNETESETGPPAINHPETKAETRNNIVSFLKQETKHPETKIETAKQLMLSGKYGLAPVAIRELITSEPGIRHEHTTRARELLIKEGLAKLEGKRLIITAA